MLQLETAIGAAIGVVPGAAALRVPRSRFLPVKSTNDLLVLRSDAYTVRDAQLQLAEGRSHAPAVQLSKEFELIAGFEVHFSGGAPSLLAAESLTVHGDVSFGAGVVVRGTVVVDEATQGRTVPDGTVLQG